MLEAAAVAGLEVDAELLASVMPAGRPGELVSAGLLDPEEERFRFRHPLLQEAAYQEVPTERRHVLHQQIAAAMATEGSHPAERIAVHLERAGCPEEALSCLRPRREKRTRPGRWDGRQRLPWCVPASLPTPIAGQPATAA